MSKQKLFFSPESEAERRALFAKVRFGNLSRTSTVD